MKNNKCTREILRITISNGTSEECESIRVEGAGTVAPLHCKSTSVLAITHYAANGETQAEVCYNANNLFAQTSLNNSSGMTWKSSGPQDRCHCTVRQTSTSCARHGKHARRQKNRYVYPLKQALDMRAC